MGHGKTMPKPEYLVGLQIKEMIKMRLSKEAGDKLKSLLDNQIMLFLRGDSSLGIFFIPTSSQYFVVKYT